MFDREGLLILLRKRLCVFVSEAQDDMMKQLVYGVQNNGVILGILYSFSSSSMHLKCLLDFFYVSGMALIIRKLKYVMVLLLLLL